MNTKSPWYIEPRLIPIVDEMRSDALKQRELELLHYAGTTLGIPLDDLYILDEPRPEGNKP